MRGFFRYPRPGGWGSPLKANRRLSARRIEQAETTRLKHLHPVLRRIYLGRGIQSEAELDRSLAKLPSPWLLSDMEEIVLCLRAAIEDNKHILIVADFDADGATSCAVAIRGLSMLGARKLSYVVPNRFEYGYGLTPEIVDLALSRNPDVLVTVDNGISSLEGVDAARRRGVKVLITDHHLPGPQLPAAEAIVNPNRPDDEFPSRALAGVGVMFYVLMALRSRMRESGWFAYKGIEEPKLGQLLDLVALGTVADVVPLDHINRILVHQGLQRIRSGKACPGILALIEAAGRDFCSVTASDLGYAVGPRLNAAGRLEDMALGVEALLTEEMEAARVIAARLDALNAERRGIEEQMKNEALRLLKEMKSPIEAHLPAGICLYDDRWHQGVVGILASKIKDRLHRPVIAFAPAGEGEIKGSARSIPGVHIRDALSDVAASHPGLLKKFGGHAMAAGLSLHISDYPAFTLAFDEAIRHYLKNVDLDRVLHTDGELEEACLALDFAELLQEAGPWGQGFPEPLFEGVFEALKVRIVGERHLKLLLRLDAEERTVDAIAFFVDDPESWLGCRKLRIAYRLDVNEFRGTRGVQLRVEHLERIAPV